MNNSLVHRPSPKISICLANEQDREVIYKMRHDVYAREPGQRLENKRDDLRIGLMHQYLCCGKGWRRDRRLCFCYVPE